MLKPFDIEEVHRLTTAELVRLRRDLRVEAGVTRLLIGDLRREGAKSVPAPSENRTVKGDSE